MRINMKQMGIHILLGLIALVLLFPILFALVNSFKTFEEATNHIWRIIPIKPTLENYKYVFSALPFVKITWNTFIIAAIVTIFKSVTSILVAYAFVFLDFKGKRGVYFLLISTMFIPFTVTMIPNYITISQLGLNDNIMGVALPQFADALGIFLLRQSMRTIPRSLVEVAKIEKIGHARVMKDIIVPIIKPSVVSTGIIFFINSWNEYVWPVLILKSKDNYTLSLALQMFISAEGGTDFTVAMAVSVITMMVPLLMYIIFQRYIINTFALSGVK